MLSFEEFSELLDQVDIETEETIASILEDGQSQSESRDQN